MRIASLTLATLMTLAVPSLSSANTLDDCIYATGSDQVEGCTEIIDSGLLQGFPISDRNLAIAYRNRADGHLDLGAYDQAIADYDRAIAALPHEATMFNARGVAYARMGRNGVCKLAIIPSPLPTPGSEGVSASHTPTLAVAQSTTA